MSNESNNANLLTPAQLAEIAERAERAEVGPWDAVDDFFVIVGDGYIMGEDIAKCERKEDAEFIAASRTDVPALLAHIEALQAENGRMNIAIKESNCNRCGFHISSRHANPTGKYMATATGIYCGDCEPYEEEAE